MRCRWPPTSRTRCRRRRSTGLFEESFAAIPVMSRHVGRVHRVALRRWRKRPFDPAVWREVRIAKSALRDAPLRPGARCAGAGEERLAGALDRRADRRLRFVFGARRRRGALLSASFRTSRAACMQSSDVGGSARCTWLRRSQARRGSALIAVAVNRRTAVESRRASGTAGQRKPRDQVVARRPLACGRALAGEPRHRECAVLGLGRRAARYARRSHLECSAPTVAPRTTLDSIASTLAVAPS